MDSIGERLTHARKKRVFTQESLADAIGVSRGVIYNLEKNKSEPQTIVVNAICQTLKINKDWLLYGSGEMDALGFEPVLEELYESAKELSSNEQLVLLDVAKSMKQRLER